MKVNILTVGKLPIPIESTFGSTGEWIRKVIPTEWESHIINYSGKPFLTEEISDSWIIAGSFSSVTDTSEWMQTLIDETRELIRSNIPILGVYFGHQLLATSMGGKVIPNPIGMEIGYSEIHLTEAGRKSYLYEDNLDGFFVCQSHVDTVIEPPRGSVILAKNQYGIQSIQYDEHVFGVQYHPEFSSGLMCSLFDYYRIDNTAQDGHKILPDLTVSEQVLFNFLNALKKEK